MAPKREDHHVEHADDKRRDEPRKGMLRRPSAVVGGLILLFLALPAGYVQALPSSVQYQDTLHHMTNFFVGQGSPLIEAQQQAIAWVGQQVQLQASFFAYMDAFWVLALLALAAVPLALSLRNVKPGGSAPAGH